MNNVIKIHIETKIINFVSNVCNINKIYHNFK